MRSIFAGQIPLPALVLWALIACSSEEPAGVGGSSGSNGSTSAGAAATTRPMEPAAAYRREGATRTVDVTYTGHVKDVPPGTRLLRVWLPVPRDSGVQTITHLAFESPAKESLATEPIYGNRIAYFEVENPSANQDFTMKFTCARQELLTDLDKVAASRPDPSKVDGRFLENARAEGTSADVQDRSDKAVSGKNGTIGKARGIYDAVMEHMTYDKSGTGWGKGETRHACEVGKGNCTDFHAMFMSMCRAEDIPAGFEIGLYLPYSGKPKPQKLGGYHCWAFFQVPGVTWVPVDISEADKDPSKVDYFFGNHTNNRVALSTGRDLVLVPEQAGPPLSFFLDPYAEADGKPIATSKSWDYQEL